MDYQAVQRHRRAQMHTGNWKKAIWRSYVCNSKYISILEKVKFVNSKRTKSNKQKTTSPTLTPEIDIALSLGGGTEG